MTERLQSLAAPIPVTLRLPFRPDTKILFWRLNQAAVNSTPFGQHSCLRQGLPRVIGQFQIKVFLTPSCTLSYRQKTRTCPKIQFRARCGYSVQ